MICYLDGKKIELDTSLRNRLGSGCEGVVYRYQDKAIKIYYDYILSDFKEKKDRLFTTIDTERIISPDGIVTSINEKYIGHSLKLVKKKKLFDVSCVDVNKTRVIKNFRLLEEDCVKFSYNLCLMSDVNYNMRDNGTLYFLDTGYYNLFTMNNICYALDNLDHRKDVYSKDDIYDALKIKNLDVCYIAIWNNLERKLFLSRRELCKLKQMVVGDLNSHDNEVRLSDVLEDYMRSDDTIRTLVKRV